jgi:hypothetical protein
MITLPTVKRCAASRNRRDMSIARSDLLTCACCAAKWACRNLRTRCSGVSPGILLLAGGLDAEVAVLDVACGILDVKRVASLTLRGPTRDDIVPCNFSPICKIGDYGEKLGIMPIEDDLRV